MLTKFTIRVEPGAFDLAHRKARGGIRWWRRVGLRRRVHPTGGHARKHTLQFTSASTSTIPMRNSPAHSQFTFAIHVHPAGGHARAHLHPHSLSKFAFHFHMHIRRVCCGAGEGQMNYTTIHPSKPISTLLYCYTLQGTNPSTVQRVAVYSSKGKNRLQAHPLYTKIHFTFT